DGQQRRHRCRRDVHAFRRACAVGPAVQREGPDAAGQPRPRGDARADDAGRQRAAGLRVARHAHRHQRDRRGPRRRRRPEHHAWLPGRARDRAREPPASLRPRGRAQASGSRAAAAATRGDRARRSRRDDRNGARPRRDPRARGDAGARGRAERGRLPAAQLRQSRARARAARASGAALRPRLRVERYQRRVPRVRALLHDRPQRRRDAAGFLLYRPAGRAPRLLGCGRHAAPAAFRRRHAVGGDGARAAMAALARRLGLSLLETASGVIEVANAAMLRVLRVVSVQRGYDLRDFTLIAYGGAGPIHAGALAVAAGIARVLVPAHSGAFSALGCLVSPLRYDAVRTYRGLLSAWDAKPADHRLRELQEQCVAPLTDEGIALDRIAVQWSADLRYSGQNYEIEIPWRDTPEAL